jgi:hypothetical protein
MCERWLVIRGSPDTHLNIVTGIKTNIQRERERERLWHTLLFKSHVIEEDGDTTILSRF